MTTKPHNLILFTGRKHSGKTTAAERLARQARAEGFRVAGLLAPAVYEDSRLVGFGAVDLGRNRKIDLLNRKITEGKNARWVFTEAGLKLGRTSLEPSAAGSADLIIVDEFGPLELDGAGWRKEVDLLLASTDVPVVLVVREEIEERVQKLYENYPSMRLTAAKEDSINKIIGILKERKMRTASMLKLDGMLMIGSAGANVGKTELACALIKKFGKTSDITGIKVTTIKAKDGQCPRGGEGCGVCSSLDGDFCITEETDGKSHKDTARLLAAGAKRVYWLRVLKTHLKDGLTALPDITGHGAISICESNSLRQVVEPGLFLMVKARNIKSWKGSARDVKEYSDKIIIADSGGFDFDLNQIKLTGGKWTLMENATAIIMAGGDSSRMGVDKSMLQIKDKPLIKHIYDQLYGTFEKIMISTNDAEKYSFLGCDCVRDRIPGQGPLMGIASALEASANELNFVVACDIPHIDIRFVRKMLAEAGSADMVIPTDGNGKHEPLFAIYNKSALTGINPALSSGKRKISDAFAHCKVKYVNPGAKQLINLNTMKEYEEFQSKSKSSEI